MAQKIFKGFRQVDGTAQNFSTSSFISGRIFSGERGEVGKKSVGLLIIAMSHLVVCHNIMRRL